VPSGDSVGGLVAPFRDTIREQWRRLPARDSYSLQVTGRAPLELDIRRVSARDSRELELKVLPITLAILVLAFGALVAALLPDRDRCHRDRPVARDHWRAGEGYVDVGVRAQPHQHDRPRRWDRLFAPHRHPVPGELNRGLRPREAAERAFVTAGSAVITSGLIVAVGLGALLFTPLVDTRSIGLGGLVVVAVAVLLSVTLLPALLATIGRGIDEPRWLAKRLAWYHAPHFWERWARGLIRHPWRALVLGSLAIAALSWPLAKLRIALPARHWWPTATEAGTGVARLSEMGRAGYLFPIRVLIEAPEVRT
jgi:RND superfamily putative drug exporter